MTTLLPSFSAAVFDFDGLMVNSEDLALAVWNDLLRPHGVHLGDHHYHHLVGISIEESIAYVQEQGGVRLDEDQLESDFWEGLATAVGAQGEPLPGLLQLLERLAQAGYPLAIASNSVTPYLQRALAALELAHYFDDCIIGVEQVPSPKPAPDVYLAAARCLDVPAQECLAFEDSVTGAEAALAAGMTVVFVPADGSLDAGAHPRLHRFNSLSDCLPHLPPAV